MTPTEFKAWFDGFTEAVGDAPTPEQWKKIKAKVAELRNEPKLTAPNWPTSPRWEEPRRLEAPEPGTNPPWTITCN